MKRSILAWVFAASVMGAMIWILCSELCGPKVETREPEPKVTEFDEPVTVYAIISVKDDEDAIFACKILRRIDDYRHYQLTKPTQVINLDGTPYKP